MITQPLREVFQLIPTSLTNLQVSSGTEDRALEIPYTAHLLLREADAFSIYSVLLFVVIFSLFQEVISFKPH